jgi:hypothetical protein
MARNMIEISEFTDFLARYRQFTCRGDQQAFAGLPAFFDRVRSEWPRLMEGLRQEAITEAPGFNVFRILHLERKETSLHTPMLGHLLDPTASHGQGLVFLRAFLNGLRERHAVDLPDADAGRWTVRTEFDIGLHGRLDLLIENPSRKCFIVIENKVDTHDHGHQLRNYREWIKEHRADCRQTLIYLTPDGRCPKKRTDCLCLSYQRDVLGFLRKASSEIAAPPVNEIVRQYCAIIESWLENFDEQQGRRSRS